MKNKNEFIQLGEGPQPMDHPGITSKQLARKKFTQKLRSYSTALPYYGRTTFKSKQKQSFDK